MIVFVVSTWLKHTVPAPDKHGVHFPVLEGILNFLTLQFSILLIISFRFLFLLKAVIGIILVDSCWFGGCFSFWRTTAVRFGKNQLYVNIIGMRFGSCCS